MKKNIFLYLLIIILLSTLFLFSCSQSGHASEKITGLAREYIDALAKALDLKKNELRYLKYMVAFDNAKTFKERDACYQKLLKIKVAQTAEKVDRGKYSYLALLPF